jgi:hypothetical protein
MNVRFDPVAALRGTVTPPADKSLSHRAALFAAMSATPVRITNYLEAEDTLSTLRAVQALGARVAWGDGEVVVRGPGLRAPAAVSGAIDVGNAGTLMRLLPGGWRARRPGRGRSTATPRSGAAPSTGSPCRCRRWAPTWTRATAASRRSPCAALRCAGSSTGCRWPRRRSSRAC